MAWYVYILKCHDNSLYTGVTSDLNRRVTEHNSSDKLGSKFVRARRPVILVYKELHQTRSSALRRELEIKAWTKTKKVELIKGFNQ